MVVEDEHVLGATLGPGDQQRWIVHVGDRDRLDAGLDRRAGEAVIGEDEIGLLRLEDPLHREGQWVWRGSRVSVRTATPSQ